MSSVFLQPAGDFLTPVIDSVQPSAGAASAWLTADTAASRIAPARLDITAGAQHPDPDALAQQFVAALCTGA